MVIARLFGDFLDNYPCDIFVAPFDVRLPEKNQQDDEIQTVVQPDIFVVCDEKKLDEKGCKGAPDLVIEILSESTASKDLNEKLFLYEKHRVKEYWIVNTWSKTISIHHLGKNKKYGPVEMYNAHETIKVKTLKGLTIDLRSIFKKQSHFSAP